MSAPLKGDDARALARIERAYRAFLEIAQAGMQPTLTAALTDATNTVWQEGEYDVVIEPNRTTGILHEQIRAVFEIAERHDGRVWLDRRDGRLCILWPYEHVPGPDIEDESEATKAGRKARGTTKRPGKAGA